MFPTCRIAKSWQCIYYLMDGHCVRPSDTVEITF